MAAAKQGGPMATFGDERESAGEGGNGGFGLSILVQCSRSAD